jgi:hypothetical protein
MTLITETSFSLEFDAGGIDRKIHYTIRCNVGRVNVFGRDGAEDRGSDFDLRKLPGCAYAVQRFASTVDAIA